MYIRSTAIPRDHDAPVARYDSRRRRGQPPIKCGWRRFSMSTAQAARVTALVALLVLALPIFGQQSYVPRYDIFTGFTYLNSPKISLAEPGFHLQAGLRPTT